jgi:hypothetical protein
MVPLMAATIELMQGYPLETLLPALLHAVAGSDPYAAFP